MAIKTVYDKAEDIPEGFAELYTERGGKFELTGVEGVKTQADVDRVQDALRKERGEHKTAKDKLAKFGDVDPETLPAQLEELTAAKAQLEAFTKDGKIDETKLEPIIASRVNQAVGPLQREKSTLQRDLDAARKTIGERETEVGSLKSVIVTGTVERSIRDAAVASKVVATAVDDAVLNGSRVFEITEDGRTLTKDGIPGVVAGLTPSEWFKDMQEKRPHWWPQSQGGGARGGGGPGTARADNPWSKEGWNVTKQGQVVTQFGEAKAAEMAKTVGSHLGATKPTEPGAKVA